MKKLLVGLSLAALPAFGSHHVSCDVEAEVINVANLSRLNATSVLTHPQSGIKPDHAQNVSLKVLSVSNAHGRCLTKDTEVTLAVKSDELGGYSKGEKLKLQYENSGDRLGSRVTWKVIK